MKFIIRPEQDYSIRLGGSWGYVTVDLPEEVDASFQDGDDSTVTVQDDNGKLLTEEMDEDQWYEWKKQNLDGGTGSS